MLAFPLGAEMIGDQGRITEGRLLRPTKPSLGLTFSPTIEARYPFDESAVYSCDLIDYGTTPDSYWSAD